MDLIASGLKLRLGGRQVLDGIDAGFRTGRVTAILGPNGSGKTSLIKVLAGLLNPESGAVELDGRAVSAIAPRERGQLIGYLPQDGAVHWGVSVEHLVELGRLPHRGPFAGLSDEDRAAVAQAMAATDIGGFAGRLVTELSGGERARVLLARVLAGRPCWLLADEPLASLDPAHQLDILDRLREVASGGANVGGGAGIAGGTGVVLVLHDLVQAARAADDVLLLSKGRIVAFGAADQVMQPEPLREAFGVEVTMVADSAGRSLPLLLGRA